MQLASLSTMALHIKRTFARNWLHILVHFVGSCGETPIRRTLQLSNVSPSLPIFIGTQAHTRISTVAHRAWSSWRGAVCSGEIWREKEQTCELSAVTRSNWRCEEGPAGKGKRCQKIHSYRPVSYTKDEEMDSYPVLPVVCTVLVILSLVLIICNVWSGNRWVK